MLKSLPLLLSVAVLASAAPALAQTGPALAGGAVGSVAKPEKRADGDKMICKTTEVTGSRFGSRTCKTKDEWDAMSRNGRDFLDTMTRLPCPRSSCGG